MYFRETPNRYMVFRDSGAVLTVQPKNRTSSMWLTGNAVHYVYRGMHYIIDKNGRKTRYKDPKARPSVFSKDYKAGTYSGYSLESTALGSKVRSLVEDILK